MLVRVNYGDVEVASGGSGGNRDGGVDTAVDCWPWYELQLRNKM